MGKTSCKAANIKIYSQRTHKKVISEIVLSKHAVK